MRTVVGSATLTFSDSESGTFAYVVNGSGQTKKITRFVFADPVPVCTFGDCASPFNAVPFDPNAVSREAAGSATLTFYNSSRAGFDYTLDGVSESKRITRQVFRMPGTGCQ
jgi:hypothetical protein